MKRIKLDNRQAIGLISLIAAALVVGAASLGQAQSWNVQAGNWSVASNWNPVGVPNGEYPTIANGGTCTIAASDGEVGGAAVNVGPGTIVMTGGSLTYPGIRRHPPRRQRLALPPADFSPSPAESVIPILRIRIPGAAGPCRSAPGGNLRGVRPERRLGGRNVIYVGGQPGSNVVNGTGVFTQTGGSVGAYAVPFSGKVQAIAIFVGGNGYFRPASAIVAPTKTPPADLQPSGRFDRRRL